MIKQVENYNFDSYLFKQNLHKENKLVSSEVVNQGKYSIGIYKPSTINIKPITTKPYYIFTEKGNDGADTTILFMNMNEADSFIIEVKTPDSIYNLNINKRKS